MHLTEEVLIMIGNKLELCKQDDIDLIENRTNPKTYLPPLTNTINLEDIEITGNSTTVPESSQGTLSS